MRRLLITACAVAILVAAFAGVASARLDARNVDAGAGRPVDPFRAPAALPAPDREDPSTWGYRSSEAIARQLEGASDVPAAGAQSAAGGASASVTVTAIVLPVVILVVDTDGTLKALSTNTHERDARGVRYVVRTGSVEGAPAQLDAALWAQARRALARTHAGLGTVWTA